MFSSHDHCLSMQRAEYDSQFSGRNTQIAANDALSEGGIYIYKLSSSSGHILSIAPPYGYMLKEGRALVELPTRENIAVFTSGNGTTHCGCSDENPKVLVKNAVRGRVSLFFLIVDMR